MSCSFTVQVLAQLDLLRNFCPGTRRTSVLRLKAYKNNFKLLPKELDATVKLHFLTLGAELSAMAGALEVEELLAIELQCETTPAGAFDHKELLHVEFEMRLLKVEDANPSC